MRPFADVLEEIADQAKVYDVLDAAVRGAKRRRKVRVVVRPLVAVAVVVALVACSGLVLGQLVDRFTGVGRPEPGPGRLAGDPPALVQPLLDSPTRGTLAGDQAFLDQVLTKVAGSPDDYGMPHDRAKLRVLFAGDVPTGRRLVLVAGLVANPRYVELVGRRGADAGRLKLTGWADVDAPIIRSEHPAVQGDAGYLVMFGPTGYDIFQSDSPRYLADGTIRRDWQPVPADYVQVATGTDTPRGLRFRFSRTGKVLYEDGVAAQRRLNVTVDPAPLHGRGKPEPRAAQSAAEALAHASGLQGPDVHYVVLWSDDYEITDPSYPGPGQIATVMAVTADGGGPYLTLAVDSRNPPEGRNHPTGQGIFGDPEKALIVMRLPWFSGGEPSFVQIVAPPTAVRAEVRREGTVIAATNLANGIGRVTLAAGLTVTPGVTVRAYDAGGAVVAERPYQDVTGNATNSLFEPEIRGW